MHSFGSLCAFLAFRLAGVGVRTVSFLRVKVYVVGFYADMNSLEVALSSNFPIISTVTYAVPKVPENASFDEKLDYIVANTACAIRIGNLQVTSAYADIITH